MKTLPELPNSKDTFWDGAETKSVEIIANKPVMSGKFKRRGIYAIPLTGMGTDMDFGVALDWRIYDIVDGVIVKR